MAIEKNDKKKTKSIKNTFHLPTWITGDVKNLNEDEEFVSEARTSEIKLKEYCTFNILFQTFVHLVDKLWY